jgi:hypothetical protein
MRGMKDRRAWVSGSVRGKRARESEGRAWGSDVRAPWLGR